MLINIYYTHIYMRHWTKTCNFDFLSKIVLAIWKSSSSRSQKLEFEVSKLYPRFLKKLLNFELKICRLQISKRKLALNAEKTMFIIWYQFWNHNFHHVVKKQRNLLAIFGPFLNLQEFLKIEGLVLRPQTPIFVTYSTSSFIWLENFFRKKNQNWRPCFKVSYIEIVCQRKYDSTFF